MAIGHQNVAYGTLELLLATNLIHQIRDAGMVSGKIIALNYEKSLATGTLYFADHFRILTSPVMLVH